MFDGILEGVREVRKAFSQSPYQGCDPPRRGLINQVLAPSIRKSGSLTQKLQVVGLKAERLVHMLQKSARCRDKNIHSRQAVAFVFEILPTDNESCRKSMVTAYGTQYVEYLYSLSLRHDLHSAAVSDTHQFSCW